MALPELLFPVLKNSDSTHRSDSLQRRYQLHQQPTKEVGAKRPNTSMQKTTLLFKILGLLTVGALSLALTACGGGGGAGGSGIGGNSGGTSLGGGGTNGGQADEDTASTIVTSVPASSYATGSEEAEAFEYLNAERSTCGFGKVAQNAKLDVSATGHANYLISNNRGGHYQDPSEPGYTGNSPGDRATSAGYAYSVIGDDNVDIFGRASIAGLGADSIQQLLSAPYHAASMLSGVREVGIKLLSSDTAGTTATFGPRAIAEYAIGVASDVKPQLPAKSDVLTYPCDGSTATAYQLVGESPNPIPGRDLGANPIGQPLYVMVREGHTVAITSAVLVKASDNSPVTLRPTMTAANDPQQHLEGNNIAILMPDAALLPNTSYSYTVSGTNDGVPFTRSATFKTKTGPI
ncbi:CAP domain-containing protein [Variovorax sp. J22R115]|uniref:CAP domain-containing protein n=1 Tax=Variovorax sp. J22R115 TaxID=3053509 RepID=UPI00257641D6|nr:CAP domain-containing protein [Variovorax sp. J22R115]MDM0053835.1 CAP domain-containing protein [Variovorax sp. J22R115]